MRGPLDGRSRRYAGPHRCQLVTVVGTQYPTFRSLVLTMNRGIDEPDWSPESVTMDLLQAVADGGNEDARSVPPSGDRFDPGALDRPIESTSVPTEVTLQGYDCTVTIDGEGDVTVTHTYTSW